MASGKARQRRRNLRDALWGEEIASRVWPLEDDEGWAPVPRVLPIIFRMLDAKEVSRDMDLSRVYLGLLTENMGEGIVEIDDEEAFASVAGLRGERGVRSWRDRVRRLQKLGFIDVKARAGRDIGIVLIYRPYAPVKNLHKNELVPEKWWTLYLEKLADFGVVEYAKRVRYMGKEYELQPLAPKECAIKHDGAVHGFAYVGPNQEIVVHQPTDSDTLRKLGPAGPQPRDVLVRVAQLAGFPG